MVCCGLMFVFICKVLPCHVVHLYLSPQFQAWRAVGLNVCVMLQFQYGVLLVYVYFYFYGLGTSCCRFIFVYPYSFSMACCWFMFYSAVSVWHVVGLYLCLCLKFQRGVLLGFEDFTVGQK
jgi:hypothetical protein